MGHFHISHRLGRRGKTEKNRENVVQDLQQERRRICGGAGVQGWRYTATQPRPPRLYVKVQTHVAVSSTC